MNNNNSRAEAVELSVVTHATLEEVVRTVDSGAAPSACLQQ